jgi:hypothetical protein
MLVAQIQLLVVPIRMLVAQIQLLVVLIQMLGALWKLYWH